MCMKLIKGNVKVEWEDIGEGYNGDYNSDDPNDKPLLRFYVSKRDNEKDEYWKDVEDASYCTLFNVNASDDKMQKALAIIMDRVYDAVSNDVSVKKTCEELSYISDEEIK